MASRHLAYTNLVTSQGLLPAARGPRKDRPGPRAGPGAAGRRKKRAPRPGRLRGGVGTAGGRDGGARETAARGAACTRYFGQSPLRAQPPGHPGPVRSPARPPVRASLPLPPRKQKQPAVPAAAARAARRERAPASGRSGLAPRPPRSALRGLSARPPLPSSQPGPGWRSSPAPEGPPPGQARAEPGRPGGSRRRGPRAPHSNLPRSQSPPHNAPGRAAFEKAARLVQDGGARPVA